MNHASHYCPIEGDPMIIDIFQDTVCPWCRIGKKNLTDALENWSGETVEVRYRAFQLDPTMPEEGRSYRETMENKIGGTPERMQAMLQQVTNAGAAVGLTFNFNRVEKMPNTLKSHQLISLAPEENKQLLVDTLYRAYFEEGRDIGDVDILLDLAEQAGLARADVAQRMQAKEGLEQVEDDLSFASQIGITGVPFFIINDKYALTGAQPSDTFLQALEQISQKQD
jgi:predicted DsbA family dithiol-disulfide isomerase